MGSVLSGAQSEPSLSGLGPSGAAAQAPYAPASCDAL